MTHLVPMMVRSFGLSTRSQTLFLSNSLSSLCIAMIHFGSFMFFNILWFYKRYKGETSHKFLIEDWVCAPLLGSLMMFFGGCWDDNLNLLLSMDGVWSLKELVPASFEESFVRVSKSIRLRGLLGLEHWSQD